MDTPIIEEAIWHRCLSCSPFPLKKASLHILLSYVVYSSVTIISHRDAYICSVTLTGDMIAFTSNGSSN